MIFEIEASLCKLYLFLFQSDLFQDDLFPPTKVIWEPTMTATEWFSGGNKQPRRISLKPPGMDNCKLLYFVISLCIKINI